MKLPRIFGWLLLLAAFATSAQAQADKTREQVRAELDEAIRTGDMIAGESGLKLNELYPQRYPAVAVLPAKTREQVKAELADAIHTGDMIAGESGLKLNELYPQRYPAVAVLPAKTREQVKAELAEAIRTGDMISGESGRTLYEQFPERYAKARRASQVTQVAAAASAPLR